MSEATKPCTECGEAKLLHEFAKSPEGRLGLRARCRQCCAVKDRDYLLQRRFGITASDFDILLERQGGGCALCGTRQPLGRWGRFAVDHCHETGRVRGLLCNRCNAALGVLGDTPTRIARVHEYVLGGVDR